MTREFKEILIMVAVGIAVLLLLSRCAPQQEAFTAAPACSAVQKDNGALIACPDGTTATIANGAPGSQGPQGPQGLQGPQGAPGLNGTNATPITVVQLCNGAIPAYPSTFPEVAFCIDGTLYGVYNGNEAYQYLSSLPNGAYSSDGQGAACSFTITGCSVTY